MPNKLLIKANFCDLRNVKEETLAAYDVIEVRANVVVLNDRAKELIARYPVTLKCDLATDNPNIALRSADGERRTENCFRLGRSAGAVSADYGKRAGILPAQPERKAGQCGSERADHHLAGRCGATEKHRRAGQHFCPAGQTGPVLGGPLCCDAGPRAGCCCPGKAGRAVRYAQGNFGPKPCHTGRPAV